MAIFTSGTNFGKHQILRLLGAGEVAEVYEVVAPDGAHRALKILKEDAALSSKVVARLSQEGDVIATIEHVSVVRYYDIGIEQGRVWLLLELVLGPNLGQLARSAGGALPAAQAVSIVRQACDGVAAAHARNILHRDLRPENILVTPDDGAKVTDFGSAKLSKGGVKTTRDLDVSASLYAAPECLRKQAIDDRSDVFAMGVILHEVLTGAHPLIPHPVSSAEAVRRILLEEAPRLDTLGRDLPSDLADVAQRAMAKDPARRGSMREMADALAAVLHHLHARRRAAARSLPLPNREIGLAMTEPALRVFDSYLTTPMPAARATALPPVSLGETPKPPAQPVSLGETPKPPAQPVSLGETPKPPAQPVSLGETRPVPESGARPVMSQPVPQSGSRAVPQSGARPMSSGAAASKPVAAETVRSAQAPSAPAPWVPASSGMSTTALPISMLPSAPVLPSRPSPPSFPATIAMSVVPSLEERRSTTAPVEQVAVAVPSKRPSALPAVLGMVALLVLGLLAVGWAVVRPAIGVTVTAASGSPLPPASASASAGPARKHLPPRIKTPGQ